MHVPNTQVYTCMHTHTQTHAYFKKENGEGGRDERKTEGKEESGQELVLCGH